MRTVSTAISPGKTKAYQAILWGGLVAGTLDITAAFIQNGLRGIGPVRVLQSVASGLLGASSRNGGLGTAALGLGLHFFIATGAAAVYYAASRKLPLPARRVVVGGLLYGSAVYFFMNFVVLPLSAFPYKTSFTPKALITGLVIHMFCVGLPIALVVRRYSE